MNLHAIRAATEIGDRSGFISFDQLNELLSPPTDSKPRILKLSLKL